MIQIYSFEVAKLYQKEKYLCHNFLHVHQSKKMKVINLNLEVKDKYFYHLYNFIILHFYRKYLLIKEFKYLNYFI